VLSVTTLCQPCSSLCTFLLTAHVATAHCSLFLGSDHTSKLHTAHCSCAQTTLASCTLLTAHVLKSPLHTAHYSCAQITPANCSMLTPHVLRSHKQNSHCSLLISLIPTCTLQAAHSLFPHYAPAHCSLLVCSYHTVTCISRVDLNHTWDFHFLHTRRIWPYIRRLSVYEGKWIESELIHRRSFCSSWRTEYAWLNLTYPKKDG